MGTKENPGQFDCYGNAAPNEPLFVLRATDWTAPILVRLWADTYRLRKQSEGEWAVPQITKYNEARRVADEMENWFSNETRASLERHEPPSDV